MQVVDACFKAYDLVLSPLGLEAQSYLAPQRRELTQNAILPAALMMYPRITMVTVLGQLHFTFSTFVCSADKMSQSVLGSSMTESQILGMIVTRSMLHELIDCSALGNSFTQSGILVDLEDPAQAQPKPPNASAKKS